MALFFNLCLSIQYLAFSGLHFVLNFCVFFIPSKKANTCFFLFPFFFCFTSFTIKKQLFVFPKTILWLFCSKPTVFFLILKRIKINYTCTHPCTRRNSNFFLSFFFFFFFLLFYWVNFYDAKSFFSRARY